MRAGAPQLRATTRDVSERIAVSRDRFPQLRFQALSHLGCSPAPLAASNRADIGLACNLL
eukprot:5158939-Pyramimonas_sp.AAC.1